MPNKLNVKIILGSTRQGRFSDKAGSWIEGLAKQRPEIDVELLDLRDYPMPFFDEAETPGFKQKPYSNPVVVKWTAKIAEADAFIIIAPEYNHGYTAVLKNAIDYVYQEWNKKAVAFVGYGSVGGARAVEQLREVAVELQMAPTRTGVHIPWEIVAKVIGFGTPADPTALTALNDRVTPMFDQLVWWGKALKTARTQA